MTPWQSHLDLSKKRRPSNGRGLLLPSVMRLINNSDKYSDDGHAKTTQLFFQLKPNNFVTYDFWVAGWRGQDFSVHSH